MGDKMKLVSYVSVILLAIAPFAAMAEDAAPVTESTSTAEVATEPVAAPAPEVLPEPEITIEPVSNSNWYDGIQFGVGVSATSGLNGFVGYANKDSSSWLMRRLGVRFDFASTKPISSSIDSVVDSIVGDEGFDIDEITINEVGIEAQHIGAVVDFYPFGDTWFLGGWRISGGYFKGGLTVDANLTGNIAGLPADEFGFSFGGIDYKYTGGDVHGTAAVDWDYSGPYIGTGFDLGIFAGFKIYVDAGVVFTDKAAEINVDIPTDNLQQNDGSGWKDVDVPALDAEIDRVLSDAQSELDDVKFYPMVKVGFMYRF